MTLHAGRHTRRPARKNRAELSSNCPQTSPSEENRGHELSQNAMGSISGRRWMSSENPRKMLLEEGPLPNSFHTAECKDYVKHHKAPGVGGGACQARSVNLARITCRGVVSLGDIEFESYAVSLAAGSTAVLVSEHLRAQDGHTCVGSCHRERRGGLFDRGVRRHLRCR